LQLSPRSRLAVTARDFPTLAIALRSAAPERARALEALGVRVEWADDNGAGRIDLTSALQTLAHRGVARVFSEGGPTIGAVLIEQGLADEVLLFTAQKPLGRRGRPALDAAAMRALENGARYAEIETACLGVDTMRRLERLH
jgi:diaminohydroxyphosphoribosylaminopyrimidine deaminase/5-amino-6-(5-phosphoribosylamino)uracil reductase